MIGPIHCRLIAVVAFLGGTVQAVETQRYHVSTQGNDRWSGALSEPATDGGNGPFATLSRARQAVRMDKKAGLKQPVEVLIEEGTYRLDEPLVFSTDDSGTESTPIIWQAKGKVILSGGRAITGWRETTLNGKTVWVAEIPEVKTGQWYFHQLFVNGQRRRRPRLPKQGFYRFTGSPRFARNVRTTRVTIKSTASPATFVNGRTCRISKWWHCISGCRRACELRRSTSQPTWSPSPTRQSGGRRTPLTRANSPGTTSTTCVRR